MSTYRPAQPSRTGDDYSALGNNSNKNLIQCFHRLKSIRQTVSAPACVINLLSMVPFHAKVCNIVSSSSVLSAPGPAITSACIPSRLAPGSNLCPLSFLSSADGFGEDYTATFATCSLLHSIFKLWYLSSHCSINAWNVIWNCCENNNKSPPPPPPTEKMGTTLPTEHRGWETQRTHGKRNNKLMIKQQHANENWESSSSSLVWVHVRCRE